MTTTGSTGQVVMPLKFDVAELIGFRCVSTGDTSTRLKITENGAASDATILFLNAGDIDYTTAKDTLIALDDTVTGLGSAALADHTGAAATISGGQGPWARSPIVFDWSNGTSGDVVTIDLFYRGPLYTQTQTITIPNPAATASATFNLRSKFARVKGFTALSSADTGTRIQITDADSRTVYLDAADKDYTTVVKRTTLTYDDTLTGLTPQNLDATGVAATATSAAPLPVVRSPLTVSQVNNGTAGATCVVKLFYDVN